MSTTAALVSSSQPQIKTFISSTRNTLVSAILSVQETEEVNTDGFDVRPCRRDCDWQRISGLIFHTLFLATRSMKEVGSIYIARATDKTGAPHRASHYVRVLHRASNINAAERGEMERGPVPPNGYDQEGGCEVRC